MTGFVLSDEAVLVQTRYSALLDVAKMSEEGFTSTKRNGIIYTNILLISEVPKIYSEKMCNG